ncbi:outer membrane beta-barrel protein, partial [Bacteroidales bacterium AH-315-I05]|nr:outer membrane beta-barrel protein [Bacteroidales bacterium AH-315-I05]
MLNYLKIEEKKFTNTTYSQFLRTYIVSALFSLWSPAKWWVRFIGAFHKVNKKHIFVRYFNAYFMKKLLLFTFIVGFLTPVFSQDEETHEKRGVYDRILMDVYFENWLDTSYKLPGKWHSRGISGFYLYDIPFEKNSQFSSAIGLGASSHNVFLKDSIGSHPDSTSRYYTFLPIESNDNFKKYKFSTNYIDAALELRFRSKPDKFGNRIKFTLGARVGYLVNIHSKTVRNKRDRYKWFL